LQTVTNKAIYTNQTPFRLIWSKKYYIVT